MVSIEFQTIKICNFLSIGEEISFDYRQGTGLTYVHGVNKDTPSEISEDGSEIVPSNGSGKSTGTLNALLMVLYGKLVNKVNNQYIFNRQASWKDIGYIELTLKKNMTDAYRIYCEIRTSKKRDRTTLKYSIEKNGEDVTPPSKGRVMSYIEENIIGCSFELFKNSIVISSSNVTNFFQMPLEVKNKYLQGVFLLNSFGLAYDDVCDKLLEIKKTLKTSAEKLHFIQESIKSIEQQNSNWIEEHQLELEQLENKLQELNEAIQEQTVEEPKNYEKLLNAVDKIEAAENKSAVKQKERNKLQKQINNLESEIKAAKFIISKNQDILETVCDKCLPKIKQLYKIDENEIIIENNTNNINQLKTQLEEIDNFLDNISSFLTKARKAQKEVWNYQKALSLIEKDKEHNKQLIESYKKRIKKNRETENPFNKLLTENLETKNKASEYLKKLTLMQQYYGALKFIFSDDGVKKYIINDIIDALNGYIKSYLIKMGASFYVYFDNNLYYNFITPTGPCDYFSFSAGERKKLDLAILFAFRDILSINSVQFNTFICDEIIDGNLDAASVNAVVQILKNKAKITGQAVYLISHRESLAKNDELFDHKLLYTKENGTTRVSWEM